MQAKQISNNNNKSKPTHCPYQVSFVALEKKRKKVSLCVVMKISVLYKIKYSYSMLHLFFSSTCELKLTTKLLRKEKHNSTAVVLCCHRAG